MLLNFVVFFNENTLKLYVALQNNSLYSKEEVGASDKPKYEKNIPTTKFLTNTGD